MMDRTCICTVPTYLTPIYRVIYLLKHLFIHRVSSQRERERQRDTHPTGSTPCQSFLISFYSCQSFVALSVGWGWGGISGMFASRRYISHGAYCAGCIAHSCQDHRDHRDPIQVQESSLQVSTDAPPCCTVVQSATLINLTGHWVPVHPSGI